MTDPAACRVGSNFLPCSFGVPSVANSSSAKSSKRSARFKMKVMHFVLLSVLMSSTLIKLSAARNSRMAVGKALLSLAWAASRDSLIYWAIRALCLAPFVGRLAPASTGAAGALTKPAGRA
jgi:hypothetical protein